MPEASHPSLWPYVIGVWLMSSGAVTPFMAGHSDLFHRIGYAIAGAFIFMLGAAFFLIGLGQRRENLFVSSRSSAAATARLSNRGEFTRPDDPAGRLPLEGHSLPTATPRPRAAGGSLAPAIIGVWFVLAMGVVALIDFTIHGTEAQSECTAVAMGGLLVGLAVALRIADRRRKNVYDSKGDQDSAS